MQNQVKENYTISGYFVFFLIGAPQAAAGILNFQSHVLRDAGQDSWISIILVGLSLHLIIWMIYKMLGNPAKDVIDLHRLIFGKLMGNAISLLLVGYYFIMALFYFRAYIEIIQVWVFPTVRTWAMAGLLICMIYYVVSGGFRVVAGFSFFYMALIPLLFLLYFPIRQGNIHQLLPVLNHSFLDLLKGAKSSSFIFFGLEALLIYFPFLKSPEKNVKWAHFALLFTTLKYTAMIIVTLMYFSQGLLKHTLWPTLAMSKIIELSFVARFEYFYIFMWLLVIIPTVCIPIWCCTRMMKRVAALQPRLSLPFILAALFIAALTVNERIQIDVLEKYINEIGFYFIFAYIPLLFIINTVALKLKSNVDKSFKDG
ncbi:spore germination protein (amino acid permease) [Paenibacillus endophyticus]|uniref:Spore germination protein (Amino acid permease) n=1 Tax=Paenibacillus endophyticus TaxID=1294268 RepID=A0A7W5C3N8_9BACL|nr:GerAB/ArcD/ProY family transporter [Paenibacillus endophyticus]MBB3150501.1 spore germination protein (amino acid permease) [Paenibacillus endophyticus]